MPVGLCRAVQATCLFSGLTSYTGRFAPGAQWAGQPAAIPPVPPSGASARAAAWTGQPACACAGAAGIVWAGEAGATSQIHGVMRGKEDSETTASQRSACEAGAASQIQGVVRGKEDRETTASQRSEGEAGAASQIHGVMRGKEDCETMSS